MILVYGKMKHRLKVANYTLTIFLVYSLSVACQEQVRTSSNTVGTIYNTSDATDGYVLFTVHNKTYLINNCGEVVHQWSSNYSSGKSVYLLENGNLLRAAEVPNQEDVIIPGIGGRVELFDWEGNLLWEYLYSSSTYSQHHEVYPMPNGNILVLAVTVLEEDEARELGRKIVTPPHRQLYNEQVLELKPKGSNQAEVVWEWNVKDHLVQEVDPNGKNFGKVADHPRRLDINYLGSSSAGANWLHINSMQYDETRDQIVLCSRHLNEIYIIDHSTSTEEAAGSTGGNHGFGGDFLYRWGNPMVYGQGSAQDQMLYGPHAAHWVPGDGKHSGNIIIFNNGVHRKPEFSQVYILNPSGESGAFQINQATFGPETPHYIYQAPNPTDFYSEFLSNAQVLPNGHLFICAGEQGHFFEIDENEKIVWEYINPVGASEILRQGAHPDSTSTNVFRAKKYPADYVAFKSRTLTPGSPIEKSPNLRDIYNCSQ